MLIELGADIDAKDNSGYTPLYLAAQFDSLDVVNLLIDLGANAATTVSTPAPTPTATSTPTAIPTPQTVTIQSIEGTPSSYAINIGEIIELQNFQIINVEELNKLGGVVARVKWGDIDGEWIGVPIMADTGEIINLSHAYQSASTFHIYLRINSDTGDVIEYSYEIIVREP